MKIGDCFVVSSSYGDARSPWLVYRRIRFLGTQTAECYRFEKRPDTVGGVGEYVLRPSDPIPLETLQNQTPLSTAKWQMEFESFLNQVNEPWNVE